ncbi:MAG: glycogen debranching enzyme alpha-1,6-glucosidase [Satyrvirus sp.]|uniref:Glycogen debranching enzyme alpha-1,6-glucosidase n=1 Tax=Satyrvirus sp. TaxID=2487771 RepID=A0A3G5AHJ4_9VIRU|nr:MAG: glycogen debranching enzyme alpha-1,6-glucosidase [Satyrvirus sp.]
MSKNQEARNIITNCIGKNGIWASDDRYKYQCWTRDFCLAIFPVLMYDPNLQSHNLIMEHLRKIVDRQNSNGKIPILFLDNEKKFLEEKILRSIETGKISFMLKRFLDNEIEDLTPHTRDSELLFIVATCEFLNYIYKNEDYMRKHFQVVCDMQSAVRRALSYVENYLLKDGLVAGADWRDVRTDLDNKNVLTNACLLYKAYKMMNEHKKAANVQKHIQDKYWNGTYFVDYPGNKSFDLLGNSLAIMYDIANEDQAENIFNFVLTITSEYGIKTCETFLPPLDQTEKIIMERDNAVIWPFTNGFMLEAMIYKGGKWLNVAKNEFDKWSQKLAGFYEWYDIKDGNGYGSKNQVWSAALYLRVYNKLKLTCNL